MPSLLKTLTNETIGQDETIFNTLICSMLIALRQAMLSFLKKRLKGCLGLGKEREDIVFEKLEDITVTIKIVTFPDRSICYFVCSGPKEAI